MTVLFRIHNKLWNGIASLSEILLTKFFFGHRDAYKGLQILPWGWLLTLRMYLTADLMVPIELLSYAVP